MRKNLLKALIFGLVFSLCPTTNLTKVVAETEDSTNTESVFDEINKIRLKHNLKISYDLDNSTKTTEYVDCVFKLGYGWNGNYDFDVDEDVYYIANNDEYYYIKNYYNIPKSFSITNYSPSTNLENNVDLKNCNIVISCTDSKEQTLFNDKINLYDTDVNISSSLSIDIPEEIYNENKNDESYYISLKIEFETKNYEEEVEFFPDIKIDIEYYEELPLVNNFTNTKICLQYKLDANFITNDVVESYGILIKKGEDVQYSFYDGAASLPEGYNNFNSSDKSKNTFIVGINNIPISCLDDELIAVTYAVIDGKYYYSVIESFSIYELLLDYIESGLPYYETEVFIKQLIKTYDPSYEG